MQRPYYARHAAEFKGHIIQDLPHLNRLGVFCNLAELPEDLQSFYTGVLRTTRFPIPCGLEFYPNLQRCFICFIRLESLFLSMSKTPRLAYALQHGYSVEVCSSSLTIHFSFPFQRTIFSFLKVLLFLRVDPRFAWEESPLPF